MCGRSAAKGVLGLGLRELYTGLFLGWVQGSWLQEDVKSSLPVSILYAKPSQVNLLAAASHSYTNDTFLCDPPQENK